MRLEEMRKYVDPEPVAKPPVKLSDIKFKFPRAEPKPGAKNVEQIVQEHWASDGTITVHESSAPEYMLEMLDKKECPRCSGDLLKTYSIGGESRRSYFTCHNVKTHKFILVTVAPVQQEPS